MCSTIITLMSSLPDGDSLCYSSAPFLPKAYLFAMSPENQPAAYPAHRFSIAPMLDRMYRLIISIS